MITIKTSKWKIVFPILLISIMFVSLGVGLNSRAAVTGIDFDSARSINSTSTKKTVTLNEEFPFVYYKVNLEKTGKLKIIINTYLSKGTTIEVFNKERKSIANKTLYYLDGKKYLQGVINDYFEPGLYYIKIARVYGTDTGKIETSTTFDQVKTKDIEITTEAVAANNVKASAQTIDILANNYAGYFTVTDRQDYYAANMVNDGYLKVNIKNSIKGDIGVAISKDSGEFLKSYTLKSNEKANYSEEVTAGKYIIYIFSNEYNSGYTGKFSIDITGEIRITKMKLVSDKITIKKGASKTIGVYKEPYEANEKLTFTSSDTTIVKVDKKGKITALKKGKAIITVKTESGGVEALKCTVTVK